jgi:hypothetical protein
VEHLANTWHRWQGRRHADDPTWQKIKKWSRCRQYMYSHTCSPRTCVTVCLIMSVVPCVGAIWYIYVRKANLDTITHFYFVYTPQQFLL